MCFIYIFCLGRLYVVVVVDKNVTKYFKYRTQIFHSRNFYLNKNKSILKINTV